MEKREKIEIANAIYEAGCEAYNLQGLALCVRDAIVCGEWDSSAYIGGLDVLCHKSQELSEMVDNLQERLFYDGGDMK